MPWLNRRVPILKDTLRAARKANVPVQFSPFFYNDGYYVPANPQTGTTACIYINSSLPETEQVLAVVHELTHHVCHYALNLVLVSSRFLPNDFDLQQTLNARRLFEIEAETIEAIAAFPLHQLKLAQRGLFDAAEDLFITERRNFRRNEAWKNHRI